MRRLRAACVPSSSSSQVGVSLTTQFIFHIASPARCLSTTSHCVNCTNKIVAQTKLHALWKNLDADESKSEEDRTLIALSDQHSLNNKRKTFRYFHIYYAVCTFSEIERERGRNRFNEPYTIIIDYLWSICKDFRSQLSARAFLFLHCVEVIL